MTTTRGQIPGVTEVLTKRRKHRTERLYRCVNGLALGAVKGGPFTLGNDEAPWEIFTIDQRGIPYGNSVGFVTDAQLRRVVARLAAWPVSAA